MPDSQHAAPDLQPLSAGETAGKVLSAARTSWSLSVEEIAENLNLRVETIRAIEHDDYGSLPGQTFTRGYIRSYAGLLRLNPDEVIALLDIDPKARVETPVLSKFVRATRLRPSQSNKKRQARSFFKFIFITLIVVFALLFGLNQWSSKLDTAQIAELFKLPISEETAEQVIAPEANNNPDGQSDRRGALIRIE